MPGPKSDKAWADAIRIAVNEHLDGDPKKPKKIRQLATNLVNLALEGKSWAVKEVGQRLDGKPKQQQELSGPDGGDIPMSISVNWRES